jgi:hypothetical protein
MRRGLDPGLGVFLRGQSPTHEALNLILAVDREVVMVAIDLAGVRIRDQSPKRRWAKAGLVIRWLTARPRATYGFCGRNIFRSVSGGTGAVVSMASNGGISRFLRKCAMRESRKELAAVAMLQ